MVQTRYIGFCEYADGLALHKEGPTGTIYGFEHPSTITLGVRGNASEDLVNGESKTREQGFKLAHVDRGGHAVLHNPGQLVIYPKLHLPTLNLSVRDFVCILQKATLQLLVKHGIQGELRSEPGVYVEGKKIAALGLRIHKGTAHHGLAINVCNDLREFQWIRTCGVNNAHMTSMQNLGVQVSLEEIFFQWVEEFSHQLSLTHLAADSTLANSFKELRV